MLDRAAIEAIIPHRDPFLLIDRILEINAGTSAVGELDVRDDAFWVPGHFPAYAVMPGVLIVEALAQVGAVALLSLDAYKGKLAFFAGIDGVRFKRQVRPGDTRAAWRLARAGPDSRPQAVLYGGRALHDAHARGHKGHISQQPYHDRDGRMVRTGDRGEPVCGRDSRCAVAHRSPRPAGMGA